MVITWDATYESLPTSALRIGLIDNNIRDMTFGIRERMSVEHEWGPSSDLNDGSHILGGTSVLETGNQAALNAFTGMSQGSLYLLNTGADMNLMIYVDGAWTALSTVDHDALTGTTDDDHPQYVLKDGGVMTGALNMSNFMVVSPVEQETYSDLVLKYHMSQEHPGVGNPDAIVTNTIPATALKTVTQIDTYVMNPGDTVYWTPNEYEFFPALYQLSEGTIYLVGGSTTEQLGLYYQAVAGAAITVKVYREWVDA